MRLDLWQLVEHRLWQFALLNIEEPIVSEDETPAALRAYFAWERGRKTTAARLPWAARRRIPSLGTVHSLVRAGRDGELIFERSVSVFGEHVQLKPEAWVCSHFQPRS
jgi:hypothetical protein